MSVLMYFLYHFMCKHLCLGVIEGLLITLLIKTILTSIRLRVVFAIIFGNPDSLKILLLVAPGILYVRFFSTDSYNYRFYTDFKSPRSEQSFLLKGFFKNLVN